MTQRRVSLRAIFACAALSLSFALFVDCASPAPPPAAAPAAAPAPAATPAAAAAPAAPPAAAPAVGSAPDWTAAPTNGSPGVDAPKLTGHELLNNTTFDGGKYIPWTTSFTTPGTGNGMIKDGQFCINVVNKGVNPWDAQTRHREMIIQKGHVYSIAFMAHATKPVQMKVKVGMSGPPYKEYWADTVDLTTHPQSFVGDVRDGGSRRRRPRSSRSTSAA